MLATGKSWERHDAETLSVLLARCEGNPPTTFWNKGQIYMIKDIETVMWCQCGVCLKRLSLLHLKYVYENPI